MEMKNKRIVFIIMTIGFILIISGSVSTVLLGLKADREETLKRVSVVGDQFEIFSANTSVFEAMRDDLYENYLGNIYYDTMVDTDKDIKNKLSNYEHLVDELAKNTVEMDNLCEGVYYPDSNTNSKCQNYKTIYEQVNNYFVSDIDLYNNEIGKFNDYQKEANSNTVLQEYTTKKDYIDYNKDNKIEGKEE